MYEELVKRLRNLSGTDNIVEFDEAADAIEQLNAEYVSLEMSMIEANELLRENRNKWYSVANRLPEYGKTVLVYGCQGGIYTAVFKRARNEWERDHWWKLNSKFHDIHPTHWMPLPEPPKEET